MDVASAFINIIHIVKDSKCKFSQSEYLNFKNCIKKIEYIYPEFNENVPIIEQNNKCTYENKIDHETHPAWQILTNIFQNVSYDDFDIETFKYQFLQMYHVHKVRKINYFEQLNLNESFLMSLYFYMYH
jgi:hypothetical protein